jgi:tetratricopeptide (TPR) repeat protein
MTSELEPLRRAQISFQQRDYAATARCCEQALADRPQDSEAHELLGLSWVTLGRVTDGIAHLRQAVAHGHNKPGLVVNLAAALTRAGGASEAVGLLKDVQIRCGPSAELLYNLAAAQQATGDTPAAIDSYHQCVQLNPLFAEAHNNLGIALDRVGRSAEAIAAFRAALKIKPEYLRALTNLGNALRRSGQLPEATEVLNRALELAPDYPQALCNLAKVQFDRKRLPEAIALYARALAGDSGLIEAQRGLAAALLERGEYPQALENVDRTLTRTAQSVDDHINRGRALQGLERHADALLAFEHALALKPDSAEAWNCRGLAQSRLGQLKQACDSYQRALTLTPDYPSARFNHALARLTLSDFAAGWPLFEARLQVPGLREAVRHYSLPRWRGEPVAGKRVWVHAEYGLGDTLQFCRYLKLLRAQGAEVVFEVQPALATLMRTLGADIWLVDQGAACEAADYHCPLLSLPLAFGTDAATIPAEPAYLKAAPAGIAHWAKQLAGCRAPRVGIAWRGNLAADERGLKGRAIALSHFEALLHVPDISLISLQKGPGAEELQEVAFQRQILDFGATLDQGPAAFADTAAIMMNLDLVITIDTSIAHLAGALGVPVWVALHTASDWRWQLARSDSPWYPGMRLFRQSRSGEWNSVMQVMATELTRQFARRAAE